MTSGLSRAQHCRQWLLFADWCTANGRSSLPATPATVATFLAELPAGPGTVARRVRAIDAAHRHAGLAAPGEANELDEALGRHPVPPRFASDLVARALGAIPVGGWPVGIVGRRDAAIVALICAAGLTRAQVHALRTTTARDLFLGKERAPHCQQPGRTLGVAVGEGNTPEALAAGMTRAQTGGSCPACGLTRWLRVAADLERSGWRAVRAELADLGEIPAGAEVGHDCEGPLAWPTASAASSSPLFCAIDRRGAPQTGYPLSTRSITAIVAGRLHACEQILAEDGQRVGREEFASRAAGGRRWGPEDRRRVAERFAEVEATLDDMEAEAEAIMAKVRALMGDEARSDRRAGE